MLLDVFYALIAFRMLGYLPAAQDMTWVGKPLGLLGQIIHDPRELWRMAMGLGLTVICWTLSNRSLTQLRVTDRIHTMISLVQTGFVYCFLYFAVCDPMLVGGPSSRALQCGSLTLAGISGQWGWAHARRHGLVAANARAEQLDAIGRSGRTGTATAVLTTPLSWVGAVTWTLGWVLIPLVITQVLPRLGRAWRDRCE